ncbi:flavin reductase family protein [Streptomyces longispororuber]|uniref:flavin reductase family protein n=1 Tax=Streptomyces longispororuber TaxID=68230 RepID=UPI00210A20BB|nr:flavin reductase family protein [Streptomyces longispororuber]MCQ4206105.1 flavin reductase family protein [Streptomyces longispororuber]
MTSTTHLPHLTVEPSILYFGTPVALLSTENADGTFNLAPMSSAWALGRTVVLGLGADGQSARNLAARPDVVVSLPGPGQWEAVERLAPLTGRDPVPASKPRGCRYEPDKFGAAGLTPQPSVAVRPPRVAECPLQLEARAVDVRPDAGGAFLIVETSVLEVHATADIVVPGTDHIDPVAWSPLVYNFRHYFGLGPQLGHTYRSETARSAAAVRG